MIRAAERFVQDVLVFRTEITLRLARVLVVVVVVSIVIVIPAIVVVSVVVSTSPAVMVGGVYHVDVIG